MAKRKDPRVIAFYLPQYHPIPENDEWWGAGFTEWTNVVRGQPAFLGHHQPQVPADLGFYDLRLPEARAAQADLARQYGIHGFCYYYYWFSGTKLLNGPLEAVLASGQPDLPFCICWANENWTRRWDGLEQEVLIAQQHSPENDERFFHDVAPILADDRYIRVDGKPLLLVYRVNSFPDPRATAARWRQLAKKAGLGKLHLCAVQSFKIDDPQDYGFDAAVEFPPHPFTFGDVRSRVADLRPDFEGLVFDYNEIAQYYLSTPEPPFERYRGLIAGWDNTARRGNQAYVVINDTPANYEAWLTELVRRSDGHGPGRRTRSEPLIFVNAWNEWAEGTYLEPDLVHGRAYLEATDRALATGRAEAARRRRRRGQPAPLMSVVIPSYNHAAYIGRAIESVAAQTYEHVELVIVDDGSSDESMWAIDEAIGRTNLDRVIVKSQPNLGAAAAIDRGVLLGSGEYVTILNSDDEYHPRRLENFADLALDARGDVFAFSAVDFYCSVHDAPIGLDSNDVRIRWYTDAARLAPWMPTAGFALLRGSMTATTSNFFFNRGLFDKLRGFENSFLLSHDWDFALRATHFTEPVLIPQPLLTYRFHSTNAHASLESVHLSEGRSALDRYLSLALEPSPNPLAPNLANWPRFFDYFVGRINSWFSPEVLRTHLAVKPADARNGAMKQRAVGRGRDEQAVERLSAGLQAVEGPLVPVLEALGAAAARWGDPRESPPPARTKRRSVTATTTQPSKPAGRSGRARSRKAV